MKLYEIVQEKEWILPENLRKLAILQAILSIIISTILRYLFIYEVLSDVKVMWGVFFIGLVTTTYYYLMKYEKMIEVLSIRKTNSLEIFTKPRGGVFVYKKDIISKSIDLVFENLIYIYFSVIIASISIVSTASIYLNCSSSQETLVCSILIVIILIGVSYSAIKMYKIFVQSYLEIYEKTGYIVIS